MAYADRSAGVALAWTGAIALYLSLGFIGTSLDRVSAKQKESPARISARRMADGKEWTTQNLAVDVPPSYCYEDASLNCRQYGRLYTWDAARRSCKTLGGGWRLPTDDEWRRLAKHYGGVHEDADDGGKASYSALLVKGVSEFNALLGGNRSVDGKYERLSAHGFYWTASEGDPGTAWYYNFGKGSLMLYRQSPGSEEQAISVRCIRD